MKLTNARANAMNAYDEKCNSMCKESTPHESNQCGQRWRLKYAVQSCNIYASDMCYISVNRLMKPSQGMFILYVYFKVSSVVAQFEMCSILHVRFVTGSGD